MGEREKSELGVKILFYCWVVCFIGLATLIAAEELPKYTNYDVGALFLVVGLPAFFIWLLYKEVGRKGQEVSEIGLTDEKSEIDLTDEKSEIDLTDEKSEKDINLVQLIKAACEIAEGSLECIDGSGSADDIYEKERVEKLVKTALAHCDEIQDDFYRSAALHSIADLLSKAGQYDRASNLIEQISEDFIHEKATEFLAQQKSQSTKHSPTI